MKFGFVFLIAQLISILPVAASGQYSNASLDGPWIIDPREVSAGESAAYIVFDGQGTITDQGWYSIPDTTFTYSVQPGGSFSMTVWMDRYTLWQGRMQSDSVAVVYWPSGPDTLLLPILRVPDASRCQGTWSGAFVKHCGGVTHNVVLTIGNTGEITFASGLVGPVSGRFYYRSGGLLVGHLRTGETAEGWSEIGVEGGSLVIAGGGAAMGGVFGLDCTQCDLGKFNLGRDPLTAVGGSPAVGHGRLGVTISPNPFHGTTMITYELPTRASARLSLYGPSGRLVESIMEGFQTAGPHAIQWNAEGRTPGVYLYQLRAGREASAGKCILLR